jgi:hypothetical protein
VRWDAFSQVRKWCWSVHKNRFASRRATLVVYHCVILWGGSELYLRVRYWGSLQLGAGRQATLWATILEHPDHDNWIDSKYGIAESGCRGAVPHHAGNFGMLEDLMDSNQMWKVATVRTFRRQQLGCFSTGWRNQRAQYIFGQQALLAKTYCTVSVYTVSTGAHFYCNH